MAETASVMADLIGPSVLDKAEAVRRAVVDFRAYTSQNLISEADQNTLMEFVRLPSKTEFLDAKGAEFFQALLRLYAKTVRPETLSYFITLLDDATQANNHTAALLAVASRVGVSPVELFIAPFDRNERDPYILHQNARVLSRLASVGLVLPPRELRVLAQWLAGVVSQGEPGNCELALQSLQRLLSVPSLRADLHLLIENSLVSVLTRENRVQAQYYAVFCLWELSFDPSVVPPLAEAAASKVALLLKTVRKEKLARVCVAFMRNLLEKMDSAENKRKLATTLITQKVLHIVEDYLKQKTFQDEEILADSEYIVPQLHSYVESMSSFEEYRAEVLSGQLEWSPVHRSERFWRENINNVNEKNGEVVKALARYLESSPTYEILSIAIHDLGQYVRFHPRGKALLDALGAKAAIVGMMEHADPAVRYEALVATQKILTQNWEFLGQKLKTKE